MQGEAGLQNQLAGLFLTACFTAIGFVLLYGARRKWRWLVYPPEWLYLVWSQSLLKVLFGRRFVLGFTYCFGAVFAVVGLWGLLLALIQLGKSSFVGTVPYDIPQQMATRPLSPGQLDLWNLLKNIVTYANILVISIWILIGIKKRWFLRGNPPQWLKRFAEDPRSVRLASAILMLIIVVCAVLVYPDIEELGRRLGYWK
jgi:hypothetical protein